MFTVGDICCASPSGNHVSTRQTFYIVPFCLNGAPCDWQPAYRNWKAPPSWSIERIFMFRETCPGVNNETGRRSDCALLMNWLGTFIISSTWIINAAVYYSGIRSKHITPFRCPKNDHDDDEDNKFPTGLRIVHQRWIRTRSSSQAIRTDFPVWTENRNRYFALNFILFIYFIDLKIYASTSWLRHSFPNWLTPVEHYRGVSPPHRDFVPAWRHSHNLYVYYTYHLSILLFHIR